MSEPATETIPQSIDWKPVIFSPDTSPGLRKAYTLFSLLCILSLVMIIWPVAVIFNRGDILILGLPINLAWLAFWKGIIFLGLFWLYRYEYFRNIKSS